ncbi:hypothetical protein BMW22_34825 (plasmid) [Rhizobium leguminosarum]|uniref:Uncharacterized protein n=1 Tax=Rhizobium leguminosarum TaxID=384 RepID=A0A1L3ZM12_RHILE|nr:hypothetical protein BMW22_34825 [Rhizobium leguminosarum]
MYAHLHQPSVNFTVPLNQTPTTKIRAVIYRRCLRLKGNRKYQPDRTGDDLRWKAVVLVAYGSHMCNLRSKLDAAGLRGMLVSLRGVGYRMDNTHD